MGRRRVTRTFVDQGSTKQPPSPSQIDGAQQAEVGCVAYTV